MCEALEVDRLFAPETQHDIFSLPLLLTSILPPLSHCTSPSGRQYAILSGDSLALNLCFSLFEFSGLEDRRRTNPSRYREFTGLVSDREASHLPCHPYPYLTKPTFASGRAVVASPANRVSSGYCMSVLYLV